MNALIHATLVAIYEGDALTAQVLVDELESIETEAEKYEGCVIE
jgi:hypothetical protein